jgi:diaminohydroxyphosphoribosylaminopyrimidine deaminase/5-amino-6-(5-phosphoribosylamino)uracil reductase
LLTSGTAPEGWAAVSSPEAIADLHDVNDLLVEGGAGAATAFLAADLVDRLIVYRAPILIGDGQAAIGDIGLARLADAHGRWVPVESRMLGIDRRDVYERVRQDPG